MRSLDVVVKPFVCPMISFGRKGPDRFDVIAQFIRHNETRFAKAGDQSRKETLGSFGVSAWLHKDIQRVPARHTYCCTPDVTRSDSHCIRNS
jgi:hypothetical protein